MGDGSSVEQHKQAPAPAPTPASVKQSINNMGFHEAIAGASAGLLTFAIFHPVDTIKTILQSSTGVGGTRAIISNAFVSRGGIQALYRGASPALLGTTVSWATYLQIFYALKRYGNGGNQHHANQSVGVDMFASAAAGGITSALTNPIWMVKTRMQLLTRTNTARAGAGAAAQAHTRGAAIPTVTLVRRMFKEEGIATFYRGLVPSLWLVSNAAIQFTLYERLKLSFGLDPSVSQIAIASGVSKFFATVVTYPLQVVRTRLQEPGARQKGYNSFPTTMRLVALQDGIAAFYRGIGANLVRVIPQSTVTLVIFETVLKLVR